MEKWTEIRRRELIRRQASTLGIGLEWHVNLSRPDSAFLWRTAFMRILLQVLLTTLCTSSLWAQDVAKYDRSTQLRLKAIDSAMSDAMKAEDESEVRRLFQQAVGLMEDQAGLPETPDEFRAIPAASRPLSPVELASAFDPYIPFIENQKWWRIGLDPAKSNHSLREVATVMEGCLAARKVNEKNADKLLAVAREAGDFLVWTQEQAGTGVLPFPAVRNGQGRPFEVAEEFYRRAEQNGNLDQVIANGWTIDDLENGGLQFDNGLAGVALIRLFEATKDEKYKRAAVKAADWALTRPIVTNWNYNSFSVFLLSETFRATGDEKYLAGAKKKSLIGVLPGQLTEGPRKGRWGDPHNARPAYHYILVRGLASLAAVLPPDDEDRPRILKSLRLALKARNPDFQKGVCNADSSVEALVLVKSMPAGSFEKLQDCYIDEALDALERYAAHQFRKGKPALSPGAWGQLLALRQR